MARGTIIPSEEAQLPLLAPASETVPLPSSPAPAPAEKIRRKRSQPLESLPLFPDSEPSANKKTSVP